MVHVESEDGVSVAVHDYGGTGTPTLFVHGTGMCARMWEPVIARLPEGVLRPLAVDVRGHGLTVTPPDTTFFDHRMVADLCAVVDAFDVVDGFTVAHSMGAAASILTSLERPEALTRIWAYEPIIMEKSPEGIGPEFLDGIRGRRKIYGSRAEAFERYSSRPPLDELDPLALRAYLDHGFVDLEDGTVMLACDPENEARAFEQFLQDGFSRLGLVTAEVLVGYGAADEEAMPAQSAPDIAAAIAKGQAEEYSESAHFGAFGDLDRVVSSICRFLDL